MVDGPLHHRDALGGVDARCGEELVQRDIAPVTDDLIQFAFQLAGIAHPQPHAQRRAAAEDLGQRCDELAPVEPVAPQVDGVPQPGKACHKEDGTEHRAEGGQVLVPLFRVLLLGGGDVVAVNGLVVAADGAGALVRAGVLGPEIAGVVGVFLLFFQRVPIDGAQDEEQDAQFRRHGEKHQKGDGGDAGEIMFAASWLHGAKSS